MDKAEKSTASESETNRDILRNLLNLYLDGIADVIEEHATSVNQAAQILRASKI